MQRTLRSIDRVLQVLNAALTAFALAAMFATVITLVIARFVFGIAIFWGEELARYLMIYMAFIGASVAMRCNLHPRLTVFATMLPLAVQKVLEAIIYVLLLLTLVILFWQGLDIAREEGIMRTPALRIEYFWVFLAVPVGAALMVIQLLSRPFFPSLFVIHGDDDIPEDAA
ncbi:MAG: hypothetical protein AcusKO_20730 [Acuticoccus sp.]